MSTSGDRVLETVRTIEDDFADAMARMYSVGNELARLRTHLLRESAHDVPETTAPAPDQYPWAWPAGTGAPAATAPQQPIAPAERPATPTAPFATAPPAAPVPSGSHPSSGAGAASSPPSPPVPSAPPPPRTPWWQREGIVSRLLAVVGTGVTLIGVALLLALAIQMGFFGPLTRVICGGLLAVGLVVAAVLVRSRQSSTVGALGLAATGIATGYLDILAITRIYEWVPAPAGLAVAGLVALGGLLLARTWDSELLSIITVLGVAGLAPAVGFDQVLLTGTFLLVLTIASWPAHIGRSWPFLEIVRVVPTSVFLAALALTDEPLGLVAITATMLAVAVLGASLAGTRVPALPEHLGVLLAVASSPMVVTGLAMPDRWGATALFVALTCMLVLVAGLAHHPAGTALHLRLPEVALAAAGLTSLLAAARATAETGWTGAALLAVCLLWAVTALVLSHRVVLAVALGTSIVALLAATSLLPLVMLRSAAPGVGLHHLASAVGVVLLLALLARAITTSLPDLAPVLPRILTGGALLGVGAVLILLGVLLGQLLGDPRSGFTAGQAGATVVWLGIAAALLLLGLRGSSVAVPAGLALAAFSVGKLLLFDLAFLSGIARVLSFIVGGLLLLGTGAGYAQALERSRRPRGRGPVENSTAGAPGPPTV